MSGESHETAWRVTLGFWVTLAAAAGLYALVSLAPKFRTLAHLDTRHFENQVRLVTLEERIVYLTKVREALKEDPEFATELARLDFQLTEPGELRLEVDKSLRLDPRLAEPAGPRARPHSSWVLPLWSMLANNQPLRVGLLVMAAVLVLLAFSVLQESQVHRLAQLRVGLARGWQTLAGRYR